MFVVTFISSCIAVLVLLITFSAAKGAPQEAAGAALALCFAIIPYVIARSLQIPAERAKAQERHAALLAALREDKK